MAGEIEKAVIKQNAAQVCDEGGALLCSRMETPNIHKGQGCDFT